MLKRLCLIFIGALFALLLISGDSAFAYRSIQSNDVQAEWLNRFKIKVTIFDTEYTFEDTGEFDNDHNYTYSAVGHECYAVFSDFGEDLTIEDAETGDLDIDFRENSGTECDDTSPNELNDIQIASAQKSQSVFYRVDENTIDRIDEDPDWRFIRQDDDIWLRSGDINADSCRDQLVFNTSSTVTLYEMDKDFDGAEVPDSVTTDDCKIKGENLLLRTGQPDPASGVPTLLLSSDSEGIGDTTGGGDFTGSQQETCESTVDALGWLFCPLAEGVINVLSGILEWVVDILDFNIADRKEGTLRQVWSGFRTIANLGFVIAFFATIYSAASGNILSAYDVKRLIPRLFVAVVGVQLSFFISLYLLGLVNDIGQGISDLMLSAVGGQDVVAGSLIVSSENPLISFLSNGLLGLFTVAIVLIAGAYSIVGILLMAIVFLIRNMGLVALIVLSPLAFVAWILPGTENMFKRWWGLFTQLLLIYPIAAIFIASGQLVGSIWLESAANDPLDYVIGAIAIFTPFFTAPFLFKFAGGTMSGIFRGAETLREKASSSRFGQTAKSGNLVSQNSRLAKTKYGGKAISGLNTATRTVTNPGSTRLNPLSGSRTRRQAAAVATTRGLEDEEYKNAKLLQDAKYAEIQAQDGDTGHMLLNKVADYETDSSGNVSVKRLKPGVSHAETRAAVERLTIDNEYEKLTPLMQQLSSSEVQSDRELAGKLIQDNIGTWSQKAPQLYKGAHGSAGAANALSADQLASMHPRAFKGMMSTLQQEASLPDDPSDPEKMQVRLKARQGLDNIREQYQLAQANPNTSSRISRDGHARLQELSQLSEQYPPAGGQQQRQQPPQEESSGPGEDSGYL